MRIADVMTTEVVTAAPATPFKQLVAALVDNDVSAVPVVDDDGRPLGVVTEADLMSRASYGRARRRALALVAESLAGRDPAWLRKSEALTAAELMTAPPATARPGDDLRAAARRMQERGVKRLLVVDAEGRLAGIVSRHDVLRLFAVPDRQVAEQVGSVLGDVLLVPAGAEVSSAVADGIVRLDGSVLHPSDRRVVEAAVAALPGVVAVDNRLVAREAEPSLPGS